MGPMIWLYLVVFLTPSHAVPSLVSQDTVFPGTGGCFRSTMAPPKYSTLWTGCQAGGDLQSQCIPTADGGYKCICSTDYQLYSDGICKPKDPCSSNSLSPNFSSKQQCEMSGGVCKVDLSMKSGFTCDCSASGAYTNAYTNMCEPNPCGMPYMCGTMNETCTPRQGDAINGFPYSCKCSAPSIPIFNDFMQGRCGKPCDLYTNPNLATCQSCTVNSSSPQGYTCGCNNSNELYIPEVNMCFDFCKTIYPNQAIDPSFNGTMYPSGDAACKAYDPNASCYVTEKSPLFYQCKCSSGFISTYFYTGASMSNPMGDNIITCVKGDPCNVTNPCGTEDVNAICKSGNGSYTCQCSSGFRLSGNKCTRIPSTACQNADKADSNPCNNNGDRNATCVATCSTTYTCKCSKGFWAKDNTCVDSNECVNQINPCPNIGCGRRNDTICRNTIGSNSCSCGDGAKCSCGTPAVCTTGADGLKKCKCGTDEYYYY